MVGSYWKPIDTFAIEFLSGLGSKPGERWTKDQVQAVTLMIDCNDQVHESKLNVGQTDIIRRKRWDGLK